MMISDCNLKPIPTLYKGYRFRSRLEARWAVFFDACGVKWEYEPEGFILPDGQYYLPDFLLHDVAGRAAGEVYVEVKGKMTDEDANKIIAFSGGMEDGHVRNPILVVGSIPCGDDMRDIINSVSDRGSKTEKDGWPSEFNFECVDGDWYPAHLGVNKAGRFELFGDDCNYLEDMDFVKTLEAYHAALGARFEHGETPHPR